MKSVIKYPGSKWAIADWIIQYFPEHHTYLEPFFGSGAVLFRKNRSHIETINDLDGEVVNFFNQVKDNLENLSKEIYFTPYARDEFERAYRENPEDKLRRAVNFCIRQNMGYGLCGRKLEEPAPETYGDGRTIARCADREQTGAA